MRVVPPNVFEGNRHDERKRDPKEHDCQHGSPPGVQAPPTVAPVCGITGTSGRHTADDEPAGTAPGSPVAPSALPVPTLKMRAGRRKRTRPRLPASSTVQRNDVGRRLGARLLLSVLACVPPRRHGLCDDCPRRVPGRRTAPGQAVDGIDAHFVEGHELPAEVARWVPAGMGGAIADGSRGGADLGRDGGVALRPQIKLRTNSRC